MERWRGRVAVVTGASAGIGAAIAYQLQDAGVEVVALARRKEKIPEAVEAARLAAEDRGRTQMYKAPEPGSLSCLQCDVSKEEDIVAAFKWVRENTKGADILVNNAGLVCITQLQGPDSSTEDWRTIMDVNVLGLSVCTREALAQMRERGVDDGHIVHIGSVAGHTLPPKRWEGWSMYFASKHAVRVLTEGLRRELVAEKSHIRVSELSPGLVRTDILNKYSEIDQEVVWRVPHLFPEDIADAVLYVLAAPPHLQIQEMLMLPTCDPQ